MGIAQIERWCRRRPPATRRSVTHHFVIHAKEGAVDGYMTVGLYEDGAPCEVFLVLAKTGEAIRGFARCWATCFSICLQYGAPLGTLIEKFKYFRFEPAGMTDNYTVPVAHSMADYVCRWLEAVFIQQGIGTTAPDSPRNLESFACVPPPSSPGREADRCATTTTNWPKPWLPRRSIMKTEANTERRTP